MPGFPVTCQPPCPSSSQSVLVRVRTRNAGRDDNDVGTSEGVLQAVVFGEISSDFLSVVQPSERNSELQMKYRHRRNMGKISGDARGVDNIVKGELVDERTGLQQEGKRLSMAIISIRSPTVVNQTVPYLANATRSAEDNCKTLSARPGLQLQVPRTCFNHSDGARGKLQVIYALVSACCSQIVRNECPYNL